MLIVLAQHFGAYHVGDCGGKIVLCKLRLRALKKPVDINGYFFSCARQASVRCSASSPSILYFMSQGLICGNDMLNNRAGQGSYYFMILME
ncbi:MAG: hypothetical protein KAS61_10615 [Spirochaetes bacterium]|nr:hypothetical protein [Spirochaetota bacterium]